MAIGFAAIASAPAIITGVSASTTTAIMWYGTYAGAAANVTNNYVIPLLDESGQAASAGIAQIERLTYKSGSKLSQQIGRWLQAGGAGGKDEFLDYATNLANRALKAGTFVTGKVGELENARVFREGSTFLVEQSGKVMSYVPNAENGKGIVEVYKNLGGK